MSRSRTTLKVGDRFHPIRRGEMLVNLEKRFKRSLNLNPRQFKKWRRAQQVVPDDLVQR